MRSGGIQSGRFRSASSCCPRDDETQRGVEEGAIYAQHVHQPAASSWCFSQVSSWRHFGSSEHVCARSEDEWDGLGCRAYRARGSDTTTWPVREAGRARGGRDSVLASERRERSDPADSRCRSSLIEGFFPFTRHLEKCQRLVQEEGLVAS